MKRVEQGVFSLILAMCLFSSASMAGPTDIMIFADFACTRNAIGDPDDCLAVEALRQHNNESIAAVVVSGGNTRQNTALKLGTDLFPTLPLYSGSSPRARELKEIHADLAKRVVTHDGKLTLLVLSPATDLAILCKHYPGILSKIEEVIFVAGRSKGDQFRARPNGRKVRDMNFEKDRAAFAYLLPELQKKRISTLFVGFRAAMSTRIPQTFFPKGFVSRSRKSWARKTRFWFGRELPAFDLVAAMAVTPFRSRLNCHPVNVRVGRDLTLTRARKSIFGFCE